MRKHSMVRILRPDFRAKDNRNRPMTPTLRDYIEVPRLSTYGAFQLREMLSMEELARLFILQKSL